MSPKKRTKNPNWPKYVYEVNGRVVYRPYIPANKRELFPVSKGGFLRPPRKLGKVGDSDDDIYRAYLREKEHIKAAERTNNTSLYSLRDQYISHKRFKKLGAETQSAYIRNLKNILGHEIKINKKPAHFGDLLASQITTPMVRRILDKQVKMYQEQGMKGTAVVNRQQA
nr:hypothetical protein [Spirochaetales bacterium]